MCVCVGERGQQASICRFYQRRFYLVQTRMKWEACGKEIGFREHLNSKVRMLKTTTTTLIASHLASLWCWTWLDFCLSVSFQFFSQVYSNHHHGVMFSILSSALCNMDANDLKIGFGKNKTEDGNKDLWWGWVGWEKQNRNAFQKSQ